MLKNLKIEKSCILHGDLYHLFKENWPNDDNFGIITYRSINAHLPSILLSKPKSEWDIAFHSASELLIELPTKLELLNKIHSNSTYWD